MQIPAVAWGRLIQQARVAQKLTQAELAALLAVSSQTVSRWERGEVIPPDATKARLAELLGVSLADLFPWPEPVEAAS